MSVEVQTTSEPTSSATGGARALDSLYNLFITEKPSATLRTSPAVPVAPVAPVPTGCAMNGVTKTVIMIAGVDGKMDRLNTAMARSKAVADIANANGNALHYVFIGGALPAPGAPDERVVDWMLAFKKGKGEPALASTRVHLVAGPREIQSLSTVLGNPSATLLRDYLQQTILVECIGHAGMDEKGTDGLWVKATSTQGGDMVGKLPGAGVIGAHGPRAEWVEPPTPLSPVKWKNELNERWAAVAANPRKIKEETPSQWQFWMSLAVQSALDDEKLPARGLNTEGCRSLAVFARPELPFGTVRRTLRIDARSMAMLPEACWMDIGTAGDSLYWGVQTWCFSTMRAMNEHRLPMLDKTPDISELQYDVSCTLGSLVQHAERSDALTPPTHPWANFDRLRGQLGPCVCGGREGQEVMRVLHWTGPSMPAVVMLLPEAYVRYVLSDFYSDVVSARGMGARAVSGFLVLHDEDMVPMRLPDVSEPEQLYAAESMGARLWRVPTRPRAKSDGGVLREMAGAPPPWRELLQYNVIGAPDANKLLPGQRIDTAAGRHVFYTHTTTADPLAGLFVRWVFAPGSEARDMPTLDVANDAFQRVV